MRESFLNEIVEELGRRGIEIPAPKRIRRVRFDYERFLPTMNDTISGWREDSCSNELTSSLQTLTLSQNDEIRISSQDSHSFPLSFDMDSRPDDVFKEFPQRTEVGSDIEEEFSRNSLQITEMIPLPSTTPQRPNYCGSFEDLFLYAEKFDKGPYRYTVRNVLYETNSYTRPRVYPPSFFLAPEIAHTYFENYPDDVVNNSPETKEFLRTECKSPWDVLIVKSGMGTGKSYANQRFLIQFLQAYHQYPRKIRILQLTSRILLGLHDTDRLNDQLEAINFTYDIHKDDEIIRVPVRMGNYTEYDKKDDKGKLVKYYLGDIDLLTLVINSMYRLFVTYKQTPPWDLLLLDEFTAIVRNMTSSPHISMKITCMELLKRVIKNSKRIMLTDADIDSDTLQILDAILAEIGEKKLVKLCINRTRFNSKLYTFVPCKSSIILSLVHRDLLDKKNCVVATNSRKFAEALAQFINEQQEEFIAKCGSRRSVLLISSKVKNNGRDMVNLNIWAQQHLLIYTPKIDNGVSFDSDSYQPTGGPTRGHFHKTYGYFTNVTPVQTNLQMLERVRELVDNEVIVSASGQGRNTYTIDESTLDRALRKKYNKLLDRASQDPTLAGLLYDGDINTFMSSLYTRIWKINEMSYRKTRQNMAQAMKENISKYVVNPNQIRDRSGRDLMIDEGGETTMKAIYDGIIRDTAKAICIAKDISSVEAKTYKNNSDELTKEQEAELQRYRIKKFFNVDYFKIDLTPGFVIEWGRRGKIGSLKQFAKIFLHTDKYFEKADKIVIDNFKGDSLIDFEFVSDQKLLFSSLFEIFGFHITNVADFRLSIDNLESLNISRINQILPNFVVRDRYHSNIPTKVETARDISSLLQIIFFYCGVPWCWLEDQGRTEGSQVSPQIRAKRKTLVVDLDKISSICTHLKYIHKDDKTILRAIQKIHCNTIRSRLFIS